MGPPTHRKRFGRRGRPVENPIRFKRSVAHSKGLLQRGIGFRTLGQVGDWTRSLFQSPSRSVLIDAILPQEKINTHTVACH